jgi:16S rRNA (adenine1518-N6/adenine1519-N6)-dimethyltransferase
MAVPARKRFGQHWLRSDWVLEQIVSAAALTQSDRVLEIGPGRAALTERLLPLVESVVAVEIDRDLCGYLRQALRQASNFLLLEGDFLTLDLPQALQCWPQFQSPNKVVANIPYNITGPILERLLGRIAQPVLPAFESIVLLVQADVANRLCAAAGSKVYGALSVRVQYLASCEQICVVPAQAFEPPPKVDSAVVRLCPRPFPMIVNDRHRLDLLVRLGFATRRKMLRNNLTSLIEPAQLSILLASLGINPQARAEALSVTNWVALCNQLGHLTGEKPKSV